MTYRLVLAGADTLAGTLLNSVEASVRLHNAQWLQDDETAYHLTLTLGGWSNDRMDSIYQTMSACQHQAPLSIPKAVTLALVM